MLGNVYLVKGKEDLQKIKSKSCKLQFLFCALNILLRVSQQIKKDRKLLIGWRI